ncbi:hypothetical protein RHGRI_038593 [Rhododendron griersonianum]|uniref:Uncharacterized protein n=1 Tax=Rhododendron griersonianum TaxID=479676 RepID=A0AAV6HJN9_9ERIC|nr:hypothetical protein RHGRI_038593 [Rhododendron griersonianum]
MPKRWSRQGVAEAWQADCLSSGKAMHCPRHAKTKGGQGMTHGMPKEGVAKAWQADCLSPGKAMHCSRHAKRRGGQGMASRLHVTGQGNALLTACQKKGCSNSKFMKQSCDAQKKGHCTFSDIIMFLPATRAKAKFATIGWGGLPPLGKPWPPDAGCHGTLLSRPLGQFLAFWPWLLVETRPVGNARKKDQNAPETKCNFKPSRKAEHGSIGQSKTLSGNSWPFGL